MGISCARSLCHDVCKTTCARSLCADPCPQFPFQDLCAKTLYNLCVRISPQDFCVRIFASGSCRASCARPGLLRKMSVSRSPQQDSLCKISVCGSLVIPLCQDLPIRIFYDHLCKCLFADLLCKISLSGCLQQDPVGQFVLMIGVGMGGEGGALTFLFDCRGCW